MFTPSPSDMAHLDKDPAPILAVVVDTEEEFDWSKPHDRSATAVSSIRFQERAQRVFDPYDLKPTYLVDYPVASQDDGITPLRELRQAGVCDIGCHLHPWVNPPHEEELSTANSYPGNLSATLERKKLQILVDKVGESFDLKPTIYKAGRYGVGPNTVEILEDLGFLIDTSVVPATEFTADGGPDFRELPSNPFWFGDKRNLLEVPLAAGFAGLLANYGQKLYELGDEPWAQKMRLRGILARSRLQERIRLTPEGVDLPALCRLTRAMRRQGQQVFVLTYHSPSLAVGHTPYVQTQRDLERFLDCISNYLAFFVDELGGRVKTLAEIHEIANQARHLA